MQGQDTTQRMSSSLRDALDQFNATEGYHRLSPLHGRLVCTDGVEYLAANAGAFWLIDAIASYQHSALKDRRLAEMQFWTLRVDQEKHSAVLTCDRDEGDTAFRQEIEFTDFPLPEQRIWVAPGGPNDTYVAMLPDEY